MKHSTLTRIALLGALAAAPAVYLFAEDKPQTDNATQAAARADEQGFKPLFDGKSLEGWEGRERWMLMYVLSIVPIVLMSFFPDRKERYLLPLLGPFALLSVRALELTLQPLYRGPKIPAWVQWAIISVMASGTAQIAGCSARILSNGCAAQIGFRPANN